VTGRINWPILVLSFLVSLMLWMIAYGQNLPRILPGYFQVMVTPEGFDQEKLFIRRMPSKINVTAKGTEQEITDLKAEELEAFLDLRGATPGTRNYPIAIFPERARERMSQFPATVAVEIEPIAEKRMRIEIEPAGELNDASYRVAALTATPKDVVVRGPKSEVDQISRVVARLRLAEVQIPNPRTTNVDLEPLTAGGARLPNVRLDQIKTGIQVALRPAPVSRNVVVSPTLEGQVAEGFVLADLVVEPQAVEVTGDTLEVSRLNQIASLPITLTGMRETTSIEVELQMPSGVKVIPTKVRVTVNIQPVQASIAPGGAR
jgi:YbbR domain-containing protein